ncbi:MAG: DinB family protein [Anaerolineae bacterium]
MHTTTDFPIPVYLEVSKKRTFTGAIEWPGWCRAGKDEASALQALLVYGPRYAQALQPAGLPFTPPDDITQLRVVETLPGNTTTDFGAPAMAPAADARDVDEATLERFLALLHACWQTFDAAVEQATGKELRKGPRGGGRDLPKIVAHMVEGDAGYLRRLAWKVKPAPDEPPGEALRRTRQAIEDALTSAVREGLPERGPRGGKIWPPRYFVRRVAWHVLDHAWEIEDRLG